MDLTNVESLFNAVLKKLKNERKKKKILTVMVFGNLLKKFYPTVHGRQLNGKKQRKIIMKR